MFCHRLFSLFYNFLNLLLENSKNDPFNVGRYRMFSITQLKVPVV